MMRAAQLSSYGDPVANVTFVNIPEPPAPKSGEVLVGMEFAPVNPADLLLAMGYYAVKPTLPSIIGNEGVGKVIAIGPGVVNVKVGDRVAAPLSSFTWRERLVLPALGLVSLPVEADPKQLAMIAVNPVTAQLLLSEFKALKPGDWVLQTAANSGVGRSVVAFAKERGLKTVNIVRRQELATELSAYGADAVVVEGPALHDQVKAAVGGADIKLALDCISGTSMDALASLLSSGGALVSYGAMSGSPVTVGPGDLIYKGLTLTGFFLGHPHHSDKIPELIRAAPTLIARGKLHVPVAAVYPLSSIKDAIAHVRKGGKVLLDINAG